MLSRVVAYSMCCSLYAIACSSTDQSLNYENEGKEVNNTTAIIASNRNSAIDSASVSFVREAALANRLEIQLSLLVREKATNSAVKAFAEKIHQRHTELDAGLKKLASEKRIEIEDFLPPDKQVEINKLFKLKGTTFDKTYLNFLEGNYRKLVNVYKKGAFKALDSDVRAFAQMELPETELVHESIRTLDKSLRGVVKE